MEVTLRSGSAKPEISVCAECMEDDYFREFIRRAASVPTCSYCDRGDSRTPIAIPFEQLVDQIENGLLSEYNDAADENVPYESAEGGYQFSTMETGELLDEVEFYAGNDDLQDRIVRALPSYAWIRRHPLSLPEEDRLILGWEGFSDLVKHRSRYLMIADEDGRDEEVLAPGKVLVTLAALVEKHGLIGLIPAGTILYRVRIHPPGIVLASFAELGPPPTECARFANRMSPAGISLSYAALDEHTALREMYVRRDGKPAEATIAVFEVTADVRVLNLVDLPPVPSIFADPEQGWVRPDLVFLHGFVRDLAAPVVKDGREHVDYVPSQVVTEYFRFRFRSADGGRLLGIVYPSARAQGTTCVLFAGFDDFANKWTFGKPQPLPLALLSDHTRRIPVNTTPDEADAPLPSVSTGG